MFQHFKSVLKFCAGSGKLRMDEIFLVCVPFPKPRGWSFAAHWRLSLQESHVPKFWSIPLLTSPSAPTLTALMMMMMIMMIHHHHHHFMVIIIIIIVMIIIIVVIVHNRIVSRSEWSQSRIAWRLYEHVISYHILFKDSTKVVFLFTL